MRINKYMADKGMCSRRKADELIAAGKVLLNGRRASLGDQVQDGDEVILAGSTATNLAATRRYVLYYKPVDIATEDVRRKDLFPIGRLDKESEGLLLLTNDGRVTKRLLEPEYDHEKEYAVNVDKYIPPRDLRRLAKGVDIEGYVTKPAQVFESGEKSFRIVLTEGKKHQIRRMCAALGYQVKQLKRVRIGNLGIGNLRPGERHELSQEEAREFLKEIGL